MKPLLSLIILFVLRISVFAQATYTISGTVTDTTGTKIPSATVFIAGSEKATVTDENGNFVFRNMLPGNYQLVVNMLGYNYVKQSITLKDKSETVDIALGEKQVELQEVVIGAKKIMPKPRLLRLFTKIFIGEYGFATDCKILNPEVLKLKEVDISIFGKSYDFLLVENNSLGYRIKYLLKFFQYTPVRNSYFYDGDFSFEPMVGTPEQQAIWEKNRRIAYLGSFMHYLRSMHAQNTNKEGFLTYEVTKMDYPVMDLKPAPVNTEQMIRRVEGSQAEFKFNNIWFYIVYDPRKTIQDYVPTSDKDVRLFHIGRGASVFRIGGQFDSRGSLNAYENIQIKGYWAGKRIAYQLPYEYIYTNDGSVDSTTAHS